MFIQIIGNNQGLKAVTAVSYEQRRFCLWTEN